MGKRNRDSTKTDFSSFMCIILMLTGCLVTIMVANIMIISANPDNIVITSVVGLTDFAGGNVQKDANYIDVYRDRLEIYFDKGPRREVVTIGDLEMRGNLLEQFISEVYGVRDTEYIVMLVRPHSAEISRRLRNAIRNRGIDLGMELFEAGKEVMFKDGMVAEKAGR
ncbi:MAG TPA: hypothetical protein PKE26_04090 [Kiritimatiellia bacterium]|nr:hypothetical protein [Kiritimatiellia bacterium]